MSIYPLLLSTSPTSAKPDHSLYFTPRFVDTKEDLVRLDINISWAGNPDIVTEVGYKGLPLILNLTDLTFKGKIRVELSPLVPIIPLFGALVCTFLEEPHVDFSFKVARLDVMVSADRIGESVVLMRRSGERHILIVGPLLRRSVLLIWEWQV